MSGLQIVDGYNVTPPCPITDHLFDEWCSCEEVDHFQCSNCGAQRCHDCDAVVVYDADKDRPGWWHQDSTVPPCFLSDTLPEGVQA